MLLIAGPGNELAGKLRVKPNIRDRVCELLYSTFDVVGTAVTGPVMVDAALRLKPDVIVAGIAMPGMDGIEAGQRVRQQYPECAIIFLTPQSDPEVMRRAGPCAHDRRSGAWEIVSV